MTKKILHILAAFLGLILFTGPLETSAQHYFGVRGGFGGSHSSRTYPKDYEPATVWGLYNGGVSWKYYTKEKYIGATEVDLLFMQQGYRQLRPAWSAGINAGDSTGYYQRKVNSVMLPIFWQPHVYMFNRDLRIFINLGVTFSYNISQTFEEGSKIHGVFDSGKYGFIENRDNRWGYGLCGGGGLGWSFNRVEVLAEVRYYIGYSDLMKNKTINSDNLSQRSPLDGLQGSIGIYYRIGKGGILSQASPKVAGKLVEREAIRYQKMQERNMRKAEKKGIEYIPPGMEGMETDGTEADGEGTPEDAETGNILEEAEDLGSPAEYGPQLPEDHPSAQTGEPSGTEIEGR